MEGCPRIAIPTPTSNDPEYNRRSWPQYAAAVRDSGGYPVEVPLSTTPHDLMQIANEIDAVLLPGSPADVDPRRYGAAREQACNPADPERERIDEFLLGEAQHSRKPVLGICYGLQSMNVFRGGTLIQDLSPLPVNHSAGASVAVAQTAAVDPTSLLGALLPTNEVRADERGFLRLPVNSSHHQAVGIPGEGLKISARCPADGVVEAIEDPGGAFLVGVQWHPERSVGQSEASRELFRRFVQEAARFAGVGARSESDVVAGR